MRPLPVRSLVNEAAQVVWAKRATLFPALIGSGFALVMLDTAALQVVGEHPRWFLIATIELLRAVLATWFAVTCHRIILLDHGATPRYGIHSWSGREMRFFGWTLVGGLCLLASVMIAAILTSVVSGGIDIFNDYPILWLPLAIPGAYVSTRLSVLLPATAIDKRFDIGWAWEITSGNGGRLLVVVALLPLLFNSLIADVDDLGLAPLAFLVRFIGCALLAFEIAALSVSFRFLTGSTRDEEAQSAAPLAA